MVARGIGFFFPAFLPFNQPQMLGPEVPAPMTAPSLDLEGGWGGTASTSSSLQFCCFQQETLPGFPFPGANRLPGASGRAEHGRAGAGEGCAG